MSLAQDKKQTILVGESGVGKTAIMDEIAYLIKLNKVPKFLENKKIIEIDSSYIMSDIEYSGDLELKINQIIDFAIKNDAIVLINEIHSIYGINFINNNYNDIAGTLKAAIDRKGLRVVGTTTEEEYQNCFYNDALKRRFDKIEIKEPTKDVIKLIAKELINNFSINLKIELDEFKDDNLDEIIDILVNLTDEEHRVYNDKVSNPDLIVSIIDKMFASAKVNNNNKLTIDDIINSIDSCNSIYESARKKAIEMLYNLKSNQKQKIASLYKKP